jgi:hypothetical protein
MGMFGARFAVFVRRARVLPVIQVSAINFQILQRLIHTRKINI